MDHEKGYINNLSKATNISPTSFIFKNDIDPKYTAHDVTCLAKNSSHVISHLSQSPDLNLIGHL